MPTVIVADLTAVRFTPRGSWSNPSKVEVFDAAGTYMYAVSRRELAGRSGREALLAAADYGSTVGMLTADPRLPGRRRAVAVWWLVPATADVCAGPSHAAADTITFSDTPIVLDRRGWDFGYWDAGGRQLHLPCGAVGAAAPAADQDRLAGRLARLGQAS